MMWQCHEHTSIVFLECLWPEFDLWQFLPVLVEWQWKQRKLNDAQAFSRSSRHLKVS
jgi:ditrans,polycis-polyprenyl diphosphate synthase